MSEEKGVKVTTYRGVEIYVSQYGQFSAESGERKFRSEKLENIQNNIAKFLDAEKERAPIDLPALLELRGKYGGEHKVVEVTVRKIHSSQGKLMVNGDRKELKTLYNKVAANGNLTVDEWDVWILKPEEGLKESYESMAAEKHRLERLAHDIEMKIERLKRVNGYRFYQLSPSRYGDRDKLMGEAEKKIREHLSPESGSDSES